MATKKGKLTKSENILICAVAVVGFAIFYKTVFLGSRRAAAELGQKIAAEETELAKQKARLAELSGRKPASPATTGSGSVNYERYLKANTSFGDVIGTLARGNGKSPFQVDKIKIEKQDQVNGYTRTALSIDVETSFLALGGFLEAIERSPLLTDIQGVEISRMSDELRKCTARIRLNSYVVRN